MPLVFIHGVGVRNDNSSKLVQKRDTLFQRYVAPVFSRAHVKPEVINAFWGDLGASFAWNLASLPEGKFEQFGSQENLEEVLVGKLSGILPQLETNVLPNTIVTDIARYSTLMDAVDLLWEMAETKDADLETSTLLADLAYRVTLYAERTSRPSWLKNINADQQFIDNLKLALQNFPLPENEVMLAENGKPLESFGANEVWDRLSEGVFRFALNPIDIESKSIMDQFRKQITQKAALFFGDVFTYIRDRGDRDNPGPIVQRIIEALEKGEQQKKLAGIPLVVVAHSMGGNIVYDTITHFKPDLEIDVLITVGSQVAFFEEMKLYQEKNLTIPSLQTPKMPKPPSVAKWLNIFDFADFLSFSAEKIFDEVRDFEYSTGASSLLAHNTYFTLPSFHRRMSLRLQEAGL